MWGKVLGKVLDVSLAASIVSMSAVIVVKAAKEIKWMIKGDNKEEKANG